jgi:hypothetical protein
MVLINGKKAGMLKKRRKVGKNHAIFEVNGTPEKWPRDQKLHRKWELAFCYIFIFFGGSTLC